jgi:hypothetical protein
METLYKTVVEGFKLKVNVDAWRLEYPISDVSTYFVSFYEPKTGKRFELPTSREFLEALIPGAGQRIEMEIRICP